MGKSIAKFTESEALFLPLFSHDVKSFNNAILETSGSLPAKLSGSYVQDDPYIRECMQLIRCASNSVIPLIDDLGRPR